MKKNLIAVKTELEYNMYDINVKLVLYEDQSNLKDYLKTLNSPLKISKDSVYKHADGAFSVFNYYYKKDAFDILKSSECLSQLNNIDFLLNIMEAYRTLQFVKESTDFTMRKKDEIIANTVTERNIDYYLEFLKTKDGLRLYNYIRLGEADDAEYKMKTSRSVIQNTINKIEEKLKEYN